MAALLTVEILVRGCGSSSMGSGVTSLVSRCWEEEEKPEATKSAHEVVGTGGDEVTEA